MGKRQNFNETSTKRERLGRLDEATLGYYRRVSETISNDFETNEEKELFLQNVLTQLSQEIVKVSQNQTVSSIVEKLAQVANPSQLEMIAKSLSQDWETACCDRFASHVTQTIVMQTGKVLTRSEYNTETESRKLLQEHINNLWMFLQSSLGLYMQHTYASHVIRTLIEVLGAVHVSDSVVRSRLSQHYKKDKTKENILMDPNSIPSQDNLNALLELTQQIQSFNKLNDYLTNSLSNPVIQTLLLVLKERLPDMCDKLIKTIIPHCFNTTEDGKGLQGLVTDSCGSHLIEQLIGIASADVFADLFDQYIKGHLQQLALHNVANFVTQKIILTCHTSAQFETVYKELHKIIEDLMAHSHLGVVVKLAEGARIHGLKQEKLIKCLLKAFHCYKPEERQTKVVPLIASLTTYDKFYKLPDDNNSDSSSDSSDSEDEIVLPTLKTINIHGSMLLQKLLSFGNPRLIVNSLLELKVAEIVTMCCDPCGSHVIDAFMKSKAVGEKSRKHLLDKLKGQYSTLACNRNGSRTLDTMWSNINVQHKIFVAEDLSKQQAKVKGDRFGFYVWRNYALHNFLHRRKEWMDAQTGASKKRKLFKDFFDDTSQTKKKKVNEKPDDNQEHLMQNENGDYEKIKRKKAKEPKISTEKDMATKLLKKQFQNKHEKHDKQKDKKEMFLMRKQHKEKSSKTKNPKVKHTKKKIVK